MFEDEEKTRVAVILGVILWSVVAVVSILIITWLITGKSHELGPYAFAANSVYYCSCDRSAFFDPQRLCKISRLCICCFRLEQYNFSGLYFRRCAGISRHYLYNDYGT